MPFDRGTLAVSVFQLRDPLPENYIELFAAKKAGMLDDIQDEPQIGFVSGRHLLESTIDETTAMRGAYLFLQLRKAERKMPGALLNAICKREELIYMMANETIVVPKRVRASIKEEVLEKHLMKMPPAISGIPFLYDPAAKLLYVGATSQTQLDMFISEFYSAVGVEPLQITLESIIEDEFGKTLSALPIMNFSECKSDDITPGRDFLTWLWFFSENEGKVVDDECGEFDVLIEGPLVLSFASEASGAAETSLKKGESPLHSAEAKAALTVGKKLRKAKINMTNNEQVWSFTFDTDRMAFTGLKLPEGEVMEETERFIDRVQKLYIFQRGICNYQKKFIQELLDPNYADYEKQIRRWVNDRESL